MLSVLQSPLCAYEHVYVHMCVCVYMCVGAFHGAYFKFLKFQIQQAQSPPGIKVSMVEKLTEVLIH